MDILRQLNSFVKKIGVDYAICGGGAIDLFVGHKTRPHKDLDVSAYSEDRDTIIHYMLDNGWDVYEPCGCGYLHRISIIADQKRIKSNIWCVRPDNRHYRFVKQENDMFAVDFDGTEQIELDFVEFLFNNRKEGVFLYARNKNVKLDLSNAVLKVNDIPFLAPELVLLYKSTAAHNPDYRLDFDNAILKMGNSQQEWLKKSLVTMFPTGHKWLDIMSFNAKEANENA